MEEDMETFIPKNHGKSYNRVLSYAQDELQGYRYYLRLMCVDQSDFISAFISWSVFLIFTFIVPAFSHFYLNCPSCDAKHSRPYDAVVQLSLSSMAALSFLCLSYFVRKFGVRRFLFFDRLVNESDSVRHHYTTQLDRSLNILSIFVLPCFVAECTYKVWWYASGASQIPFLGNAVLSDIVACSLELISWIYRTLVFFLVCVLFRLICYLQILRLKDFARVFESESDVASILVEHLRLRRHLRIISHRYRAFILLALILITLSQLTFLLLTTKPNADVSIFKTGELALCSMTLLAGLLIILRSATKITHKAQAITSLSAKWHVCATIDSFVTSETELPGTSNASPFSDDDDDAGSEEDDVDNTIEIFREKQSWDYIIRIHARQNLAQTHIRSRIILSTLSAQSDHHHFMK
ncbi:Myotubularin-related protein 10 [Bienertia sinuspersici]